MKTNRFKDMKGSIIRQSTVLYCLVFPAYIINFLFLVFSQRLLPSQTFGIFYTALSITNILVGASVVLNLFFSRRITIGLTVYGSGTAVSEFRRYIRYVAGWGSIVGLAVVLTFGLFDYLLGVESKVIVLLICLTAYVIYLAETTRAAFQGSKRFIALGVETLSWFSLRFTLGILGLALFGTAWAGLLGILLAAIIILVVCYLIITRPLQRESHMTQAMGSGELGRMFFFCLSYGLFTFVMYLDIIVAYLGIDRHSLGIYSSSCILGKSIILFGTPIIQVFFPVIVEQNERKGIEYGTILRSGGLTLAMSGLGAAFVCFFTDFIAANILGLTQYNGSVIKAIAISAIPISLLRILILLQLSKGLNKHALLLLPAIFFQIIVLYFCRDDLVHFGWYFSLSCAVILVLYGILCIPKDTLRMMLRKA